MSEKGMQFRTAAFGGFRKEDVLAYLEQSSKAHAEKLAALQRELEQVKAERAEAAEKNDALIRCAEELEEENKKLSDELAAAVARRDTLETQAREMSAELERIRPAAEAYEAVKSRTAGIELEAHGRAQAIEEEGRRKAQELQDRVARWLEKVCSAYERMRGDIDATLNHALREMGRAQQNLQDISGDFASHDKALAELRKSVEETEGAKQPPEPLPIEDAPGEQ